MPYITSERVAEIRAEIKKEFPGFKFSITRRHYSEIQVTILAAPVNMLVHNEGRGYEQVNHFYIKEHYKNTPEVRDILQKIYEIMNAGNRTVSEDGDYGSIPAFYTHLSIGKWDKPFQLIEKKQIA